jgi:hypothetical protein
MSKGPQLKGQIKGDEEILTREQVLQILSEQARKGSITAAVHLERALRLGGGAEDDDEDDIWAELESSGRLASRGDDLGDRRSPEDPNQN